jgi:multidrug transporter EmrE-like cation transporter
MWLRLSYFDSLPASVQFAVYVLVSCCGLYLLKAAPGVRSVSFAAGVLLYAGGALIWIAVLRLYPLSIAFPIASGALMAGTALVGLLLLREPFSVRQAFGMVAIWAGIWALGSGVRPHG